MLVLVLVLVLVLMPLQVTAEDHQRPVAALRGAPR